FKPLYAAAVGPARPLPQAILLRRANYATDCRINRQQSEYRRRRVYCAQPRLRTLPWRLFAPRPVRAGHSAKHRRRVAARRLLWGRGRFDRTLRVPARRPAAQAHGPRLRSKPCGSPAPLVEGFSRRPLAAVPTDPDDDVGEHRAALFCVRGRRHYFARPGERRCSRSGASGRLCASRHPLAASRTIAQRCRGRRGRAGGCTAQTWTVPSVMNEDTAAFPPDPDRCARADAWFVELRDRLCTAFEAIEVEMAGERPEQGPPGRFERNEWQRPGGGGGTISVMRGQVFEKVGVNISTVSGEFSPEFRNEIPGASQDPRFWASGISLVAHMCSPLAPAANMNTRHIVTSKAWFGGGADLTPIYPDEKAAAEFHAALRGACDAYEADAYAKYKKWCDEYFYLPHRDEPRGAGGIFFDYLDGGGGERDFAFVRAVGEAFLAVFPAIVRQRMNRPWTAEQRRHQLIRRGRYVEFNLLYDRGTRFGLRTGGDAQAILMSLPPEGACPS